MIGKAAGRDRECLDVAEHLLSIEVFRGGDHEQRRASGGESESSYLNYARVHAESGHNLRPRRSK